MFGIIPIPFDEYRYRRYGTNEFVHEQDGNNVLTYDNPCCNVGLTNDKACGLITLRLCCHPSGINVGALLSVLLCPLLCLRGVTCDGGCGGGCGGGC